MEQQQLFSQSTAAAQPANNRIDNGNNNNNSLLISSLKDLDMELNQRNAAALQELNKEIDELSEIPLDSSQLPRFKDGIEFTSSSNQATPTSTLDQQRASSARRANDVKLIDKELANGFGSLQEKLHDMDSNLAADKTKEELDRKLKNILDMSKPYQAENYSEVKEAKTPMTPFEPMDFGTDSIAAKLVNDSFKLPIDQPTPQSTLLEMNLEDVTRRLQSYRVPLKDSDDPKTYSRPVTIEQLPKIPVPSSFDILSMANDAAPGPFSQTKPGPPPPLINTNHASSFQNSQDQSLDDSRAIIAALRTLQDRVGKLENEKSAAKQKISSLEQELTTTRTLLLHQKQLNQRSLAFDSEVQAAAPDTQSTNHAAQQSEYRVSLPIPDRASDNTLRHISEARHKVGNVQEELARLEKLGQSGSLSAAGNDRPVSTQSQSVQQPASVVDHERSLDDPAILFDEILHKHSLQLLRESQKPKLPAAVSPLSSSTLPVKAWEAQAHPAATFKTKNNSVPEKSASQLAQTEIKKLQDSIIAERDLRKGELSYDPQVIKEKVLEKIKSSLTSQKPLEKKSKSDAPVWKKSESRRSRSVTKESTLSSSAHVRKRAPIELPVVPKVASDEGTGREMPFIVGRNTGKSFSVTANLQTVFSLLKSHNPEMCSVCSKRHPADQTHPHKDSHHHENSKAVHVLDRYGDVNNRSPAKSAGSTKAKSTGSIPAAKAREATAAPPHNITNQDLKEAADGVNGDSLFQILGVIEDEYRQAKAKYTHLVKQYEAVSTSMTTQVISDSTGTNTLKAIGEDLRHVIQAMEAKSDQIAILREIITSSKSLSLKKEKQRKKTASASIPKRYTMDTATSRSRAREASAGPSQKSSNARRARSQSPGRALASLSLLKSTLKVQNALGEPK